MGTNIGDTLLDRLALLHPGEVVVVERDVGHDRALVWVWHHDVLGLQQLHDAKLVLSQVEGMSQVPLRVILAHAPVIKQVGPGKESQAK